MNKPALAACTIAAVSVLAALGIYLSRLEPTPSTSSAPAIAPAPSLAKSASRLPITAPKEVKASLPKPPPQLTPAEIAKIPLVDPVVQRRRKAWVSLTDEERRSLALWRVEESARRAGAPSTPGKPVSNDELLDRAIKIIAARGGALD